MELRVLHIVVLVFVVDLVVSLAPNVTKVGGIENDLKGVETRRKEKNRKPLSTSSSEAERGDDSQNDKESLELSSIDETSSEEEEMKPKSTEERKGWRKWHRKCTRCPEDMAKKWTDPSIAWICGAYQRARRSFKSLCMMHYRNCQDGTMFVKVHDHRCTNDTGLDPPHGEHFFYDHANLSGESSDKDDDTSASAYNEFNT